MFTIPSNSPSSKSIYGLSCDELKKENTPTIKKEGKGEPTAPKESGGRVHRGDRIQRAQEKKV